MNDLATQDRGGAVTTAEMASMATRTVDEILAERAMVNDLMARAMKPDKHYGVIPGTTGDKPTLLQPGAHMLCSLFKLAPRHKIEREDHEDNHRTYTVVCDLYRGELMIGSGVGMCSTLEKKYRYRGTVRKCPKCGADAVKVSQYGGFYCHTKAGGCNAKFNEKDPEITSQVGIRDNPDIPDTWNTVLKMAQKRALVSATTMATSASDVFTVDLEEAGAAGAPAPQQTAGQARDVTPPQNGNGIAKQISDLNKDLKNTLAGVPLSEGQTKWIEAQRTERQQDVAAMQELVERAKVTAAEYATHMENELQDTEAELNDKPPPQRVDPDLAERIALVVDCAGVKGDDRTVMADMAKSVEDRPETAEAFLAFWEPKIQELARKGSRQNVTDGTVEEAPAETAEPASVPPYDAEPFELKDESKVAGKKVWGALVTVPDEFEVADLVGEEIKVRIRSGGRLLKRVLEVLGMLCSTDGENKLIVRTEEVDDVQPAAAGPVAADGIPIDDDIPF